MKRLLIFPLILFCVSLGHAQITSHTAYAVKSVSSLPPTCAYNLVGRVDTVYLTNGAVGYYTCKSTGNGWDGPYPTSAGGGGTVTNVAVVSANGQSGSVANSTTTPAITLNNPTALVATTSVATPTVTVGTVSTTTGLLRFANSASPHLTIIQAGNAAAARTYTWPLDFGAAGAALTDAAGNGTLSWVVPSAGITNSAGVNVVPKSDGTNLVASRITDDGTDVVIETGTGTFKAGDTASSQMLRVQKGVVIDGYIEGDNSFVDFHACNAGASQCASINMNPRATLGGGARTSVSADSSEVNIGNNIGAGGVANSIDLLTNSSTGVINQRAGTVNFNTPQIRINATVTVGGTTGNQSITKAAGSVNFAATSSSITVTNPTISAATIIICTVATDDATAMSCKAIAGSGSFILKLNAAATAETRVNFWIIEPQ